MTERFLSARRSAPRRWGSGPAAALAAVAMAASLFAGPAKAEVTYTFDVFQIRTFSGEGVYSDFSFSLSFNDYIRMVGMQPLAGPPVATSLGFPITRVGLGRYGAWGFDDNGTMVIDDDGTTHYDNSSFTFSPTGIDGFYDAPGVYVAGVTGNTPAHFYFTATARLTITESPTPPVPEPTGLLLTLGGLSLLAGIAAARRSERREG